MMFGKVVQNSLNSIISLNKIDLRLKLCSYFIIKIDLVLFASSSIIFKKNHPILIWNEKITIFLKLGKWIVKLYQDARK